MKASISRSAVRFFHDVEENPDEVVVAGGLWDTGENSLHHPTEGPSARLCVVRPGDAWSTSAYSDQSPMLAFGWQDRFARKARIQELRPALLRQSEIAFTGS